MSKPIKIDANGSKHIALKNMTFLRIFTTSNSNIYATINSVRYFAPAGFAIELPQGFNGVSFENEDSEPATITIATVANGRVWYDDAELNGSVFALDATTHSKLDALELAVKSNETATQSITAKLDGQYMAGLTQLGVNYKGWYSSYGISTIFTPLQNPNGAILRVFSSAGYTQANGLFISTTAPLNNGSLNGRLQYTGEFFEPVIIKNILIPPKNGVWVSKLNSHGGIFYDIL